MRNMSFALTTDAIRQRRKTVTRRLGWANLKVGEKFCAVVKSQGLKPGEKIQRLAILECTHNDPVRLSRISSADVGREGFPGMTPREFVAMFCKHMKCHPDDVVRRIVFRYTEEPLP